MMLRFFLLFAAAFALAPLTTVENPIQKDGLTEYIVVFNEDAPRFGLDIERLRSWVKQDLPAIDTSRVRDVWSIVNFTGFPAFLSDEGVRQLRQHRYISYIEESALVTLPVMPAPVNGTSGAPFTTRPDWGQVRASEKGLNLATTPESLYSAANLRVKGYPDGGADTTTWNWNGPTFSVPNKGAGAFVWVEDTGILATHNEFQTNGASRVVKAVDYTGEGSGDGNGHGTHCAGSVAGNSRGIAPEALLGSVRVLSSSGSGSLANVISGMNYVANNQYAGRFNILSMSLGGGKSTAINTAADNTYAAGVSVIVAAGNDGQDACNFSPASAANAITVAASDATDARISWSNYGTCTDLFSPGVSIHSSYIGSNSAYATLSGTSMATPLTAGAVAVYATAHPGVKASDIPSAIKTYGTQGVITGVNGSPNILLYARWDQ